MLSHSHDALAYPSMSFAASVSEYRSEMDTVCSFIVDDCIVAAHERIPIRNSTSNMPVSADHLASTLEARCSLARRLPVKAMSKYVAVLDAIGEVYPLALLANKTQGGQFCPVYFNRFSYFCFTKN
jgi:hypothetical protein